MADWQGFVMLRALLFSLLFSASFATLAQKATNKRETQLELVQKEHLGTFVLVGISQSGKSSFVNKIAGAELAPTGSYRTSCTVVPKLYRIPSSPLLGGYGINLLDTAGFADSCERMEDEDLAVSLNSFLLETFDKDPDTSIKGVIFFETLVHNTVQFQTYSPYITRLFRDNSIYAKSTTVLVSKFDKAPFVASTWLTNIKDTVLSVNVPAQQLVNWQDKDTTKEQVNCLLAALMASETIPLRSLNNIKEGIERLAEQIYENQPSRDETIELFIDEIKMEIVVVEHKRTRPLVVKKYQNAEEFAQAVKVLCETVPLRENVEFKVVKDQLLYNTWDYVKTKSKGGSHVAPIVSAVAGSGLASSNPLVGLACMAVGTLFGGSSKEHIQWFQRTVAVPVDRVVECRSAVPLDPVFAAGIVQDMTETIMEEYTEEETKHIPTVTKQLQKIVLEVKPWDIDTCRIMAVKQLREAYIDRCRELFAPQPIPLPIEDGDATFDLDEI